MMRTIPKCAALAIIAGLCVLLVTGSHPDVSSTAAQPRARRLPDVSVLEQGQTIERRLTRGDDHRFRLALTQGEYVRVIVEQRGIDVVAQTLDPSGSPIAEFEDEIRRYGEEQVDLVAPTSGTYTVVIRPPSHKIAPGSYAIWLATRRAATDADRSVQECRKLRTAAARLETEGRFEQARVSLERALTLAESAWGDGNVQVAAVAVQLAGVLRRLPDEARSASLYERAISIMDRTLGAEHPRTALARSQLAILYQHEGKRGKAEALLRQAFAVIEHTLGADHPWFVSCLVTLGNIRDGAGDLEEEEATIQRAVSITEHIDNRDSQQYADLLNDLGEVYRQKQDYVRAAALFQRSLALGERLLGADSYFIATALQNLGIVARERKDYARAVAFNERALAIRERMVGSDHPDVAHILTNLANIYRATGNYPQALATHLRALHIWENAAGPYQEATLLSVGNIAKTYAASGDVANAVAYQRRSDAILEKQLTLNLTVGSERQKLAFVRSVAERTDRTLSLNFNEALGNADASALAALVLLQRKGRVQDAMTDAIEAVRARIADVRDQSLLDQLKTTTAELVRLALNAPDNLHPEERQQSLATAEARRDQLEATLSDHSAEFRAEIRSVTLESVQAAIPENTALVEFAVFRPFDPKAERNAEAYGPTHYAAYVVGKRLAPIGVDLGAVAAIDQSIDALRDSLRDPKGTAVKARARAVDQRVMEPVRRSLGDATRLIISPDGNLNLVPFEVLVDENDHYLIEQYAMSYVTSGRDLLRMRVTPAHRGPPVIFADPLFGEPAMTGVGGPTPTLASARASRRDIAPGQDLSTVYFASLAASAGEGRAIKALFPHATLLTGAGATKAALQRVRGPLLLHIASHGFFLKNGAHDAQGTGGNPLLRSGVALAGANLTHDGHRDGILTALEASGLDLWGTKLVTLSACDTGVGEVRNGEGVYGLRRAFVLAGAETLVISLWPVSDYITRQVMVAYYTGLRAGLGRGDALRQAKLALLKHSNRSHPYYWAGFIQSGEWGPLDGTR
jgi:CHAT domain-containing protein